MIKSPDPWQVVNASGQFQNQCPGQSGHATEVTTFSDGKTVFFYESGVSGVVVYVYVL